MIIFVILSSDISIFLFNLTMYQINSEKSSEDIYFLIFLSVICLFLIIFWCFLSYFFQRFFNYFSVLGLSLHFFFVCCCGFKNFIIFCGFFLYLRHVKNKICMFFFHLFELFIHNNNNNIIHI